MTIEWFRDLVIVVFGIAATVLAIILAVVAILLYKKAKPILKSARNTARTASDISDIVREMVAPPLSRMAAVLQGLSQVFRTFSRFTKKKEGN